MTAFETALAKLEFDKVLQRVIRYAVSEPGQELLRGTRVSTSVEEIRGELSCVSELKRVLEEEDFPLTGVHPIRAAVQKTAVEGMVLLPRELMQIASTLRAARLLRAFAGKLRQRHALLWQLVEPLFVDKVLEFNIDGAIDESGAVKTSASRELQAIRRSIADKYDVLRKRLESVLRSVSDLGFSQEEIITTREGRMVIPVKVEHKNRVPGFIHSASASGATVFIEPTETLELNNEIRSLQFQEQREIERILRDLTGQVAEDRDGLLANLAILARIDALHAKAKYSIEILGVEPDVRSHGPIRFLQARHPLLLLTHGYQGTVPLDLEIGGAYTTLVISGPNAGGKSVAMKCVGLLVMMVQAGLHIPASEESVVRVFSSCFVEIGDEQSIENDLSSFSSHLANLKEIASSATSQSLVLIDEIGSGTDPAEGGAIAAAMLETLTKRGTCTIATTHHGALKVFAFETDGVENGAMEFDQTTLRPTYRFRSGVPGSSYALEMAGRLGFEPSFLQRSRDLLGHQQASLERLIADLESSVQQYRRDMDSLIAEKSKLDHLVRHYEEKVAALSKELKELKRQALQEAEHIVEQANALIERSVREIRERAAEKSVVKEVRDRVSQLKQDIVARRDDIAPERMPEAEGTIGVGSLVTLAESSDAGEVVSMSADGHSAVVVFGSVKMRVPFSELRLTTKSPPLTARGPILDTEKPAAVQRDLDLRGLTGEEALPLIDKFIDTAVLAGLHRVDIIHGKGTGALRKKVTEYLAKHPRVKSFRLGEWNEGGTGATVVELTGQ